MAKFKKSKFMFNHRRKHPAFVYIDLGKEYGFISITHSQYFRGIKNIELKVNPEVGKTEKAYILPYPLKDKKHVFSKNKKQMKVGGTNYYKFNKIKKKPFGK